MWHYCGWKIKQRPGSFGLNVGDGEFLPVCLYTCTFTHASLHQPFPLAPEGQSVAMLWLNLSTLCNFDIQPVIQILPEGCQAIKCISEKYLLTLQWMQVDGSALGVAWQRVLNIPLVSVYEVTVCCFYRSHWMVRHGMCDMFPSG